MNANPVALSRMSREELIELAHQVGVERPEPLTRPELVDEIVRRSEQDEQRRTQMRGWFGVARDLVASLVEQGLNLPDTAKLIRGDLQFDVVTRAPVATVTLAEIFASQGHRDKALKILSDVLDAEPEHDIARQLRDRLLDCTSPVRSSDLGLAVKPSVPESLGPERQRATIDGSVGAQGGGDVQSGEEVHVLESSHLGIDAASGEDVGPGIGIVASTGRVSRGGGYDSGCDATRARSLDNLGEETAGSSDPTSESSTCAEAREEWIGAGSILPDGIRKERTDDARQAYVIDADAAFVRVREREVAIYWELCATSIECAQERRPGEDLVLEVLMVEPNWNGPRRHARVIPVRDKRGSIVVESPGDRIMASAAVGWRSGSTFAPVVVASELSAENSLCWTPWEGSPTEAAVSRAVSTLERQSV